jgi:hypothetical protein
MSLVASLVAASLMLFMMILRDPLSVPYVFFISSPTPSPLSCHQGTMWDSPLEMADHVINTMSSTSIETGSSTHRYPLWVTSISFLMQLFTSSPSKVWDIQWFRISVLASPAAHYFGWKIGSSEGSYTHAI